MSRTRKNRGLVREFGFVAACQTFQTFAESLVHAGSGLVAILFALLALPQAEVLGSDAVLLEFASAHCGPCRAMQPVIAGLERRGVPVRHVDVQQEPQLASKYGIRQTPTYIVVSGGKELTRLVGAHTAIEIQRALHANPSGPLVQTGSDHRNQLGQVPETNLTPISAAADRRDPPSLAGIGGRREAMPNIDLAGAVERAQAATVRLKVHDASGFGAGTGTIIDTHGNEALIMTCGHIFRESKGQGKVEVDMFVGGQTKTVLGQVIDFDADNHDIALVAIRPGFPVQAVPIVVSHDEVNNGQTAFSFGCDHGADPSRRDTRILSTDKINRHLGNLEIQGAPVNGRSGGGLFDAQGRLIGVCNAADESGDTGVYTGPKSIRWQLDRVGLARLYQNKDVQTQLASLPSVAPPQDSVAQAPSNQPNIGARSRGHRDCSRPKQSSRDFASHEHSPNDGCDAHP